MHFDVRGGGGGEGVFRSTWLTRHAEMPFRVFGRANGARQIGFRCVSRCRHPLVHFLVRLPIVSLLCGLSSVVRKERKFKSLHQVLYELVRSIVRTCTYFAYRCRFRQNRAICVSWFKYNYEYCSRLVAICIYDTPGVGAVCVFFFSFSPLPFCCIYGSLCGRRNAK